ncbi:hypothetical protein GCM10022377_10070 [Zhihengliuella alba]|uniref:DUF7455 domain-containing protein n=1 Tax=Zhihengliuella alba TaxID=547018 RepID=A0ABP7D3E0_9MICC
MGDIIPTGTRCDVGDDRCGAAARARMTVIPVMLDLYFCAHHSRQLTATDLTCEYEINYEPVTVAA